METNKEDNKFYGNDWSMDFNEQQKEETDKREEIKECENLYNDGMWS